MSKQNFKFEYFAMSIRIPKPYYFECVVIEFAAKRKQIVYSINVWNHEGTNLALIKIGKYNNRKSESLILFLTNRDVRNKIH